MESQLWTEGLNPCGLYYEGYTDDLQLMLTKHSTATVSTYGVRRSHTNHAAKSINKENLEPSTSQDSKVYDKINVITSLYSFFYQPQIPKLYWTKSEGGREVSFDGMPFSVDKVSLLDCQYGEHYWKEKKEKENKKKRLKLQGSRKIGCHAHIRTHTYTLYPDFQLSPDESHGVS